LFSIGVATGCGTSVNIYPGLVIPYWQYLQSCHKSHHTINSSLRLAHSVVHSVGKGQEGMGQNVTYNTHYRDSTNSCHSQTTQALLQ